MLQILASLPRRLWLAIERLWQDLRHGARVFARNPAMTVIAVVSIAFGTGANVAIFSVADTLLLRPLPVARPSELLAVGSKVRRGPVFVNLASYRDYLDIRARTRAFDGLAAFDYRTVGYATQPGEAPRVRFASFISDNFFEVLGVDLALGRHFRPDETGVTDPKPVVIVAAAVWQRDFAGDPAVIGRTMRISGREFTVVGVAPETFTGLHAFLREALFLPVGILPRVVDSGRADILDARDMRFLTLKGRLHPGVSIGEAQAELTTIARDLEREYPATNTNQALLAQTEFEFKFEQRPLDSSVLVVLTVLSMAVLCVACANVAGLLASRGPVRAREMALRLAVGASRGRLIRQLVTESLAIAIAGGAGGLLVSRVGIALLRQIQFPTDMIAPPTLELDDRTLIFTLAVAMTSTLLVGLGPALQTTRVDLVTNLKSTDRSTDLRRRLTGRSALVAMQVALSLVVLTISVFTVQVGRRELDTGPGFRTQQMAKATIDPGQSGYSDVEAARFVTRVLEQARALPGVRSASATSAMPMHSFQFAPVLPEGQQLAPGQAGTPAWANSIDDRFFTTMDIDVLAGRAFTPADTADAPAVIIVNDTMARHYWPGADPIGQRLQVLDQPRRLAEVVGVVRTTQLAFPGELPQEAIYFPFLQRPRGQMVLLAHTAGESSASLDALRNVVLRLDRDVPVFDVQTMETFYHVRTAAIVGVIVRLIGGMGLMGMALTMVGLYGLVSYSVNRRTREIGIRIAVGATYARILRMVLRQGMAPAWVGLASGVVLSVFAARLLMGTVPFNYQVESNTYYIVVPIVIAVTLVAAFLPARRAARVNPTAALRCE